MPKARSRGAFAEAYKKSMKIRGMDGPVDLYIFRPIGFAIAWLLSFTRASPNAVTLVSVLFGLAAGIAALGGSPSAFLLCALLFQLSNCFDCADGQLARLTGRHSELGRLIDGLADYAVNISVFLGVLLGLFHSGRPVGQSILLVVAGGIATSISCMYYDRAISRYAVSMSGSHGDVDELAAAREFAAASSGVERKLWSMYAFYLKLQDAGAGRTRRVRAYVPQELRSDEAARIYSETTLPLLSIWSFTGPSAHVLYFLAFAAFGKIELYFEACVALALVTAILLVSQQLIEQKLRVLLDEGRA